MPVADVDGVVVPIKAVDQRLFVAAAHSNSIDHGQVVKTREGVCGGEDDGLAATAC